MELEVPGAKVELEVSVVPMDALVRMARMAAMAVEPKVELEMSLVSMEAVVRMARMAAVAVGAKVELEAAVVGLVVFSVGISDTMVPDLVGMQQ